MIPRKTGLLQEGINKLRETSRHERQNNEQQNLLRVAENLELTRELNLARKKNATLEAAIMRIEAKVMVRTMAEKYSDIFLFAYMAYPR